MRAASVPRVRRAVQWLSLATFLASLFATRRPTSGHFSHLFVSLSPLGAAFAALAGAARPIAALSLLVLLSTILFGRAFCGYVCPLGLLIELSQPRAVPSRRARSLDTAPLVVATVAFAAAIAGAGALLVFDPLSLLSRATVFVVVPLLDALVRAGLAVASLDRSFQPAADRVSTALSGWLVFERPPLFSLDLAALAILVAVLALSFAQRRLWCRSLCPLGALLSLTARFSLFGRRVDEATCTRCGACARDCPMGALSDDGARCDRSRCQLGFECAAACPHASISFGRVDRSTSTAPVATRRLLVVTAAVAATSSLLGVRSAGARTRSLIRPPGSLPEPEFSASCARCGVCMKACPTNVIQPSSEGGLLAVFTPELDFSVGYCEYSCNECGKACPTGAIARLTLDEKRREILGLAAIDRSRCIPWSTGVDCLVCQELCPVPEKAIVLRRVPATRLLLAAPAGADSVSLPYVAEDRCIGCGICQHKCPAAPEPAIVVARRPVATVT